MIFWILVFAVVGWVTTAFLATIYIKKVFKKYSYLPELEYQSKYKHVIRQDFHKWDYKQILKGCWTRLPLHFWAMFFYLFFYAMLGLLHKYLKVPTAVVNAYRLFAGRITMKIFFNLKQNFDAAQLITTPLIISNHVSWTDIIYIGGCLSTPASFVSKKEVAQAPIVNAIAEYLKVLYVDRDNQNNREYIMEQIKKRTEDYKAQPSKHIPIMIFAQGTVSNGRGVLLFKNGAFAPMAPATLLSLRYSCKQFHQAIEQVTSLQHLLITSALNPTLEVNLQKVQPQEKDTVEQYKDRCRRLIAEMGNFQLAQVGHSDAIEQSKIIFQKLKEARSSR